MHINLEHNFPYESSPFSDVWRYLRISLMKRSNNASFEYTIVLSPGNYVMRIAPKLDVVIYLRKVLDCHLLSHTAQSKG